MNDPVENGLAQTELPGAAEAVNRLISDTDAGRSQAFAAVLQSQRRAVVDAVRRLDWRDRVKIAARLAEVDGDDAELLIRALLTGDRSKHVREEAVDAVERRGSESRLRDLALALHDRHIDVRRAAGMAFFRLRDARCVSPLAEAVGVTTIARSEEATFALKQLSQSVELPQFILASPAMDPTEKLAAFRILREHRRRLRKAGIACSIPSNDRLLADASQSQDLDIRTGADVILAYLTLPRASHPQSAAPPAQLLRAVRKKQNPADSSMDSPENEAQARAYAWWDVRRWFTARH
jgi:hypothetical protein